MPHITSHKISMGCSDIVPPSVESWNKNKFPTNMTWLQRHPLPLPWPKNQKLDELGKVHEPEHRVPTCTSFTSHASQGLYISISVYIIIMYCMLNHPHVRLYSPWRSLTDLKRPMQKWISGISVHPHRWTMQHNPHLVAWRWWEATSQGALSGE